MMRLGWANRLWLYELRGSEADKGFYSCAPECSPRRWDDAYLVLCCQRGQLFSWLSIETSIADQTLERAFVNQIPVGVTLHHVLGSLECVLRAVELSSATIETRRHKMAHLGESLNLWNTETKPWGVSVRLTQTSVTRVMDDAKMKGDDKRWGYDWGVL